MADGLQTGVRTQIGQSYSGVWGPGRRSIRSCHVAAGLAVYYIMLCPAEVLCNLSRYDGQRYGFTSAGAKDLDASFKESRSYWFWQRG